MSRINPNTVDLGVSGLGCLAGLPAREFSPSFSILESCVVFLRPLRGFLLERFSPRVPLRCTLGYDPAALRGSRLSTSSSRALSEEYWD